MITGLFMGVLVGAIGGVAVGFVLEILSSIFQMVTCSGWGPEMGSIMMPCAVIGAIIGAIVGAYLGRESDANKEKAEEAEKKRREQERLQAEQQRIFNQKKAEETRYDLWVNKIALSLKKIEESISYQDDFNTDGLYDSIWLLKETHSEERYINGFDKEMEKHRKNLHQGVEEILSRMSGYFPLILCLNKLMCLKASYKENVKFDPAIDMLKAIIDYGKNNSFYLKFRQYGDIELDIEDDEFQEALRDTETSSVLENSVLQNIMELRGDLGEYFEKIPQLIYPEYIDLACKFMWCNAVKKPFNQEKFKHARAYFGTYTINCLVDNYYVDLKTAALAKQNKTSENVIKVEKVETILALIYAKNQIGGYNTVQQDQDTVDEWIKEAIYLGNEDACFKLASGLSWMGLYEMERNVLRDLIAEKVNLPLELQDRLSFLESGGTSNIMIHDVTETNAFLYDSSSSDWNEDAFNLFFRKLDLSHRHLNYSLALSKWTKTWPLEHGQKISQEQIGEAFESLIEDFDGEVTLKNAEAKALNLANVEYKNAFLFSFNNEHTERCRCVTILFASEKYGRNLNMTIITLFTPDAGLGNEELKRYAMSIKDNIYVDSFKESISQAIDEVIHPKVSIY